MAVLLKKNNVSHSHSHTHMHSRIYQMLGAERNGVHRGFEKAPQVVLIIHFSKLNTILKVFVFLIHQVNL